jgi:hypothetical protein
VNQGVEHKAKRSRVEGAPSASCTRGISHSSALPLSYVPLPSTQLLCKSLRCASPTRRSQKRCAPLAPLTYDRCILTLASCLIAVGKGARVDRLNLYLASIDIAAPYRKWPRSRGT